ncbi:flavin reductase family protein (plasmid) [Cupriavidus pinatubonensis]|uniref:flavin reductase family protein n=1 Tax=Cupriavidus pinatubonensis TaxID=248026 RepID=UPI001C731BB7|nr:flavin reductase family protein [Cupriavidus pinatubonensis]QYY34007.1 flavin reductase family protein [Cupriavidus pinatubonensis]
MKQDFDTRALRSALGSFVTGVTVVTTIDETGSRYGVTVNSFSSVSLDPPLILWSQALTSQSHPAFRDTDHFAVNILADDQHAISDHFARSGGDKFSDLRYVSGVRGAPLLPDAAAWLECRKVATHPAGDHVIYIGRIERFANAFRRPLAFGAGEYLVTMPHEPNGFASPLLTCPESRPGNEPLYGSFHRRN